jgi:hypothetical protein
LETKPRFAGNINPKSKTMKLPKFIETRLVKIFLSKAGPFLTMGISAAGAAASTYLGKQIPGLEQIITPELVAGITFVLLNAIISQLPVEVTKTYSKEIQTILNKSGQDLTVDGLALAKTTEAVKETANVDNEPTV